MSFKDIHFTLGAPDIEMGRIEHALKTLKIDFGLAACAENETSQMRRCVPTNAMHFTHWIDNHRFGEKNEYKELYAIKCSFADDPDYFDEIITPKSGLGEDEIKNYFKNSTIGQVYILLEDMSTYADKLAMREAFNFDGELPMIAAGAWCPSHAYRGLCPNIDPNEFLLHRARVKAQYQNRDVEDMKRRIVDAGKAISQLPKRELNGLVYRVAEAGYIPQLPDGCQLTGEAVEYRLYEKHTQRSKVGLIGATDPLLIDAWMEANKSKLVDMYGDRLRGFAGGYAA